MNRIYCPSCHTETCGEQHKLFETEDGFYCCPHCGKYFFAVNKEVQPFNNLQEAIAYMNKLLGGSRPQSNIPQFECKTCKNILPLNNFEISSSSIYCRCEYCDHTVSFNREAVSDKILSYLADNGVVSTDEIDNELYELESNMGNDSYIYTYQVLAPFGYNELIALRNWFN